MSYTQMAVFLLFPVLYSRFSLVTYFIHSSIYVSAPTSQFIPSFFPPSIHMFVLYLCVSISSLQKVYLHRFSRFHIYALCMYAMVHTLCTICIGSHIHALCNGICFSLSDLLHFVWQSLGPSISLEMAPFYSFLWLSNIPLYIHIFIHSSVDGHLGCFHVLATVNSQLWPNGIKGR